MKANLPMTGSRYHGKSHREGGWALLDCLIGLIIIAMVFTPALMIVSTLIRIYNGEKAASEARDNAQAALGVLGRLIRNAGCNPKGIPMQAVRLQDSSTLYIESDLSGNPDGLPDGFLDDAFENVVIQWDRESQQISLTSGAGSRQALARQISHLEMTALDRRGIPTSANDSVAFIQIEIGASPDLFQRFQRMVYAANWSVRFPILSRLEVTP